jgi:general secretion pathway protein M
VRKLQPRERVFLASGAAVVVLFLGWRLLQGTALQSLELLDRQIASRRSQIEEMQGLLERHRALQARLGAAELKLDRQGEGSFLSRLDTMVNEARIHSHLDSSQTQREVEVEGFVKSSVDLKLSRLSLAQVVDFLKRLSLGRAVVDVERLSIERHFENPDELDLALTLASYQRKR